MKAPPPNNTRYASAATRFRGEIEKAEAAGVTRRRMTLQLTLSDVSQLRRDRSLPVADISFKDGEMRYLGVKVVPGGVTESQLNYKGRE
jgi:hypothetical protein